MPSLGDTLISSAVLPKKLGAKVEQAEEAFEDDDPTNQDMLDSLSLLAKAMSLLNYLAEPDFCKSITKREREPMVRLSTKIKEFLDSVEQVYSED